MFEAFSPRRSNRYCVWTLERATCTRTDHPNAYGYTVVLELVCPHRLCGLTSAVYTEKYVSGIGVTKTNRLHPAPPVNCVRDH